MLFGNIMFIQIYKLKTMKATPQLLKYVFTWAKLFPRLDVLTEFLAKKKKKGRIPTVNVVLQEGC